METGVHEYDVIEVKSQLFGKSSEFDVFQTVPTLHNNTIYIATKSIKASIQAVVHTYTFTYSEYTRLYCGSHFNRRKV